MHGAPHLYVHLPFCAHRCGYCDYVTAVGKRGEHDAYVDAALRELALRRSALAASPATIFVGGGTPTFTDAGALERLLDGISAAGEVTVEANPETVTPALARLLRRSGVTRISVGAQSFQPNLLAVLERRAGPDDVRRAVHTLRDASFDNISIDLLYGIPDQGAADLERDLAEALTLETEHLSCYELEAKRGTRFTHAHGGELTRQAESMEGYFELVVDTLVGAGYRWYETSNFCATGDRAGGRDLRAHHNLGVWHGEDYLGVGVGAVSTIGGVRRRNGPSVARYVAAFAGADAPGDAPHTDETLDGRTSRRERIMLGLRLDDPLIIDGLEAELDGAALDRMIDGGLVERHELDGQAAITLTRRGRFLGGGVTAELLAA